MNIVGAERNFPKVTLKEPVDDGFLLLAAEVDRRLPLLPNSKDKRNLIGRIKRITARLARQEEVLEVTAFDAMIFAPGHGKKLLAKAVAAGKLTPARFDLVILIRTTNLETAEKLAADPTYVELADLVRRGAHRTYQVVAPNARRIDDVAHRGKGVFLFNYFYAENNDVLIPVWEYTAGWFTAKTHLPNSTLLEPTNGQPMEYGIINHASWPHLRTFLPHLIFRRSFRTYVLANFEANDIAAQPIVYRQL
jgi:hypothetical protein